MIRGLGSDRIHEEAKSADRRSICDVTFQDDVEAARVRAEELEASNRRLAGELRAAYRGTSNEPNVGYSFAVLGGTLVGLCAVSALVGFVLLRRHPAPTPTAYVDPPVATVAPRPVAPAAPLAPPTGGAALVVDDVRVGTGAVAKVGDKLSVHYVGTLTTGVEFDSSRKHGQPFSFPLGQGRVIKGWDQGLVGMRVGGERKLTIPPALGYGERGAGSLIPPNATLVFDVELLSIE